MLVRTSAYFVLSVFVLVDCRSGFDLSTAYRDDGLMIVRSFASAPFPHEDRRYGFFYQGSETSFYYSERHYRDSRVALFVPDGFRPDDSVDLVFYFHGWNGSIEKTSLEYRIVDQFIQSERNAILVLPAGPYYSSDSFGGKLETAGGFERLVREAMAALAFEQVVDVTLPHRIVLAAHSGGYRTLASILRLGDLQDRVREVYIFDGLYSQQPVFHDWIQESRGRFVCFYTDVGGTQWQTRRLEYLLRQNRHPVHSVDAAALRTEDLESRIVFVFSETTHREVVTAGDPFTRVLETSGLLSRRAHVQLSDRSPAGSGANAQD